MYIQVVICFFLCLQFSSFSLLRSFLKDTTPICTVLLYSEVIKLVVCSFFAKDISSNICTEKMILIPAAIFIVMNIVSYTLLCEISATTYVMLMQLKLPTTCIVSYLTINKKFSHGKIFSVLLICLSSLNICKSKQVTKQYITFRQIFFALSEVLLSSFCSVYLQKIFKDKQHIWVRNIEFCFISIPFYLSLIYYNESTLSVTYIGIIFSTLASLGGILVALSLLYCGAVGKTLVSSCSLVVVTTIEHILYNTTPSFSTFTFYLISVISLIYYNYDTIESGSSKILSRPLLEEESNT